jgi:hypothetical protein
MQSADCANRSPVSQDPRRLRRALVLPTPVTLTTTAQSMGLLGGSVLVKWPTDTGSLAGNVPMRPSSSSSSRCRFSFPPFDPATRTSIESNTSASAISSGSSPSSIPLVFCSRSHTSFAEGVPATCDMTSSDIRGGSRPSNTELLCWRFPAGRRNIGQSRNLGSVGFFASATALLHTQCAKRLPYTNLLLAVPQPARRPVKG